MIVLVEAGYCREGSDELRVSPLALLCEEIKLHVIRKMM